MSILISIIIVIILTVLSYTFGIQIIELPKDYSVHFGLITICSIFAGFLYTNYSMLLDFSNTELAAKVKNTQLLTKRDKHITHGIISSVVSIVSGLILSITYNDELVIEVYKFVPWGAYALYCTEIVFIFNTIVLFMRSLFEMKQIIGAQQKPKTKVNDDVVEKVKDQLKK